MRQAWQSLVLALPLALAATACSGQATEQGGSPPAASESPAADTAARAIHLASTRPPSGKCKGKQCVPAGVVEQYATMEEEIREAGGEQTVGPWRIAYIVEAAEPWWEIQNGQFTFREPAPGETHHIEILPIEAATGRIVPNVPIHLEVLDAEGGVVDEEQLNFYYSTFFHYADNFSIPQPGTYTLHATLEPPEFLRHGEAGQPVPLAEGAEATFTDVELSTEG